MTRTFFSSLAATAALGVAAFAPAGAAEPLKPLRTMVYDIVYSTTVSRREQTSGFSFSTTGAPTSVTSGHGQVERRLSSNERGTLSVRVMAASKDGGLVADVAFKGASTSQSTVRVAIFADGRLSYDPNTPLCPEAIRVLPFLARGLIAERDISPGRPGAYRSSRRRPAPRPTKSTASTASAPRSRSIRS